jgi:hypothetical protein
MASSIARAEQAFSNATAAAQWEETFLEALVHLNMLPMEMGYSIAELASLLEPSAIAPLAMRRMGPSRIQMRA